MKSWLDNITNEQIKLFIQSKKKCDKVDITRLGDVVKIEATQISYNDEYEDNIFTYFYNAYGEGYMYRNGFVLHQFNDDTKKWFDMVYKANIDTQIGGLTYCEAFEQAHEKALIDNNIIKNKSIEEQIAKLNENKNQNNQQLKNDLHNLHTSVNNIRKVKADIKLNLIVEDFLRRMSKQEKLAWLKSNGCIQTESASEQSCVKDVAVGVQ